MGQLRPISALPVATAAPLRSEDISIPLPERVACARNSGSNVYNVASLHVQVDGEQIPRPPARGIQRQSVLACSTGTSLPASETEPERNVSVH